MPNQSSPRCSHLTSQTIDENCPGSILIDFEVLLGFVEDGVRSTGKHHLLPMARLFELDQLMTKPLRTRLKRPQQKSFPNLNGLYLLLRATQLGVAEGHGKASGELTLDLAMHKQWLRLNPTEQYFNLLEAWLRRSSWEAVGLRGGGWMSRVALNARDLWTLIPAAGRSFSKQERGRGAFLYSAERSCTLALLELFGLMAVKRDEPDEGQSWCVSEVRRTPFGEELLQIVFNEIERELFAHDKQTVEFGAWQPVPNRRKLVQAAPVRPDATSTPFGGGKCRLCSNQLDSGLCCAISPAHHPHQRESFHQERLFPTSHETCSTSPAVPVMLSLQEPCCTILACQEIRDVCHH